MNISVVIPTYNRRTDLARCLAALSRQSQSPGEVIVVDDGSVDGTRTMLAETFPWALCLRHATNRGPAAARNGGLRAAKGEIVAFTDDDCVAPADWLEQLGQAFVQHPDIAAVGGYQEAPDTVLEANPVARADRYIRLSRWGSRALHAQVGGLEIPDLATSNVAYRRAAVLALGGFDESFPVAAGEDADVKYRLVEAGHALFYLPLKVEHHREYTLRAQWRQAVRRGVGSYHFERRRGRTPGLGRIGLRLIKRSLIFPLDLRRTSPVVATIVYLTRVGDVWGQLQAALRKQP